MNVAVVIRSGNAELPRCMKISATIAQAAKVTGSTIGNQRPRRQRFASINAPMKNGESVDCR